MKKQETKWNINLDKNELPTYYGTYRRLEIHEVSKQKKHKKGASTTSLGRMDGV